MVQPKKGSPQASAQPRRSERTRKSVPKTTVQASRVSKATPSRVTKPSRKGNPPASQPALHVGDAVPLDALEAKVTTDDGKKTSLGEQLEESGPGGLIVFVYPRADDDAYDYSSEFDYRQFNYEAAEVAMVGLTPHSVSANAALKEEKDMYFTLLSDPKSAVISAMSLDIPKTGKNVGVFMVDRQRILRAYCCGRKDNVLDQLDRAMDVLMDAIDGG